LLCCSYIIGMQLPGKQALFLELSLEFEEPCSQHLVPFKYMARVTDSDPRFNTLTIEVEFSAGDGTLIARGELVAAIRSEPVQLDCAQVERYLGKSCQLEEKVALVIGGSRGLGAAIAYGLANSGCMTFVNYSASDADAMTLQSRIPSLLRLVKADASDIDACQRLLDVVRAEGQKIDILVCNAAPAPPVLPLRRQAPLE